MKTKKLLEKLANFMDKDRATQSEELLCIRAVLKKLKTKERRLREKLEAAPDEDERRELEGKLQVVHAQRQKGLERVREIRDSRREGSASDKPPEDPAGASTDPD
jgi:predicted  nucleic acid-binding Zn-ribbon protein